MSRLRITQIEIEDGNPEVYAAALGRAVGFPVPAVVETPRVLAAPAVHENGSSNGGGRKAVKRLKKLLAPAGVENSPSSHDGISRQILAELQKKPMSSAELTKTLDCEAQQIYGNCSYLKKTGKIDTRQDDDDPRGPARRWFLK